MRIKITSDSTCDLSQELIARHDIEVLPLAVNIGGRACRDGVDAMPDDIYAHVSQGGGLPSTAAINPAEYEELFGKYASEYDAVIHFNISAEFSSCHQNAKLAAAEFENVYVVDSRNLSTGHGLLVLRAAEMAEKGVDAAVIAEQMRQDADKVDASFILDQLEYMKKGGRCSTITVLGANLLKLKPCIEVKEGKMGVGKKYRGAFEKCLAEYIRDRIADREDLELDRVFVTHSGIPAHQIDLAVNLVRELQPFKELLVTRAGCTVSSHCGPGTIGVLFVRK